MNSITELWSNVLSARISKSNKIRISIQTQLNTNKKYAIKIKLKINFANNLKHEKKN